ncbi:MAG: alpha-mannosidase [Cellulosilyticaceae bacterium]
MFFTERKLEARIREIEQYRYREVKSLEWLFAKEDEAAVINPALPTVWDKAKCLAVGERWEGRDRYLWLHKEVEIPTKWQNKKVVGIFDYGNTGAGNNSGFESLLYVNGVPYQGVDVNHKEVFFKDEQIKEPLNLTFRLWSGLEGGGIQAPQEHRINTAQIAWLDEVVDDLYYLSKIAFETIQLLDEFNPIKTQLTTSLNAAFMNIDWSYPGSEVFYESLHAADQILNDRIEQCDKHELVNVKCIGHTHIDVAWLWRLQHTREKCARSFSTVLRLMEQYPEYIFLQTQPQLYEYIKEDYPEIYARIKQKVAEGQWEVDGGMWVEADCNLTSGESLTRQILIGSQFIKQEFNQDVSYLWLPDVFGYSWALPQILKKSGIPMFMTTKISWNQYNRMPHDTFKWKGIDGSEVITHFITTPEPWSTPGSWFYTYNGQLIPKTVKGIYEAYSEKQLTNELLLSYGYGDGGGGVNRDMLECRRRIDKMPGLPNLKTSKASDYFKDLKQKVEDTKEYIHTWDGELYLEYHRGTYTSQAYNKKMNRKLEFYYREAEWLSAMGGILGECINKNNQQELTLGWKIILRNQFHDIIPGSSINEVYKDCHIDYQKATEIADAVEEKALSTLIMEQENAYTILNNTNWERSEVVVINEEQGGCWVDDDGKLLEAAKENDGWRIKVKNVPSMGWRTIYFKENSAKCNAAMATINKNAIETPFYSLVLNESGQITKLFDKKNHREILAENTKANVLCMFEDKPLAHEAWDIDIFYQEKMREVTELQAITVVENNHLRCVVQLAWQYMKTTIKQDMIFYSEDPRIDFKTWVDWRERKQLLKVAFPVDIRTNYATYDIQYGNVRRPNHWNTSWEWAKFETVAHKWVDLSERNYGISLLNDCKYGHDIKDNVIRLTLLKAATHPDTEQDQGEHSFTYSLLPHTGDFVEGGTVKAAWALNQPLKVIKGRSKMPEMSFIRINNDAVEVDAVKCSEDGKHLVVRFHEYTGGQQNVEMKLLCDVTSWCEADLMERPLGDMKQEQIIKMSIKPYEIKTILIVI